MTAHLRRWSLLALTVLATTSATANAAPTPRIHFVHEGELLRSEARAISETCARLQKHLSAVCSDAAGDELAAARAAIAGQPATIPDTWKSASRVILFEILPPKGAKKGARVTRGWNSLVVLVPPSTTPVWAERSDATEGPWLNPEEIEKLVTALIAVGAP